MRCILNLFSTVLFQLTPYTCFHCIKTTITAIDPHTKNTHNEKRVPNKMRMKMSERSKSMEKAAHSNAFSPAFSIARNPYLNYILHICSASVSNCIVKNAIFLFLKERRFSLFLREHISLLTLFRFIVHCYVD